MTTVVSLPVTTLDATINPPIENRSNHLPRIEFGKRRGPVLHAGPLPGREDVLALNLAAGCGHRCAFCSARAYPNYRGDDVVTIFADTASRLNAELTETLHQPKAVLICPSTDPFPRQTEIQEEA